MAEFFASMDIGYVHFDKRYGHTQQGVTKRDACHQRSGQDMTIPTIMNKPAHELVTALFAYREGYRENQAMQLIAKRLTDEEIAALAHYFENLKN